MPASTLTSKGQITIPKEVRDRLGVREGDRIVFQFDKQGQVVMRPESRDPIGNLGGLLRRWAKDQPATVEEMNQAIRSRTVKKFGARKKS